MTNFAGKAGSLLLCALVASLAAGAPEASAQGLFERLFGGPVKRTTGEKFPPPPKARRQTAAPAAKISAPSYYSYKADGLRRVDFSPLASTAQSASLDALSVGTEFRASVASLEGYELLAETEIGKALNDHYVTRPDFLWVTAGVPNDLAREAIRVLGEAGSHGLEAADYAVSVPPSSTSDPAVRRADLIRFEMALSARVLRYIHDAQNGRVDPNRISGYYDFPVKPLDMVAALDGLAGAATVRSKLEGFHPQNREYRALRVELEALEATAENEIVVDPKLLLRPGESSPELANLLKIIARDLDDTMGGEYGAVLSRLAGSQAYVDELVPVIKAAQEKAGLKPDGVIGPRTVSALAGTSKADRVQKVLVALEQMRWLPSELGETRVFINQPAFTARYIEDGQEKLNMRVVIGRTTNQTSFFYDELEQVDYNPYWGVPQSIIVNEMLPRLRRDPGYLDRAGYEVTDAKGRQISSSSVNWGQYGANVPFNVRQIPSEANALGELKILFPNKHAIYMHDTPQKDLFNRDSRAFSHGCVRLAEPRAMAAAVLGKDVDYVAAKISKGHSIEKIERKIPVYVAYFTAWPDKDGTVEYFGDVYERDARLQEAFERTEAVRAPSI